MERFQSSLITVKTFLERSVHFVCVFTVSRYPLQNLGILEAVVQRCSVKKVFLEISQNS